MSQSERKILIAKRHEGKSNCPRTNRSPLLKNFTNQGFKRYGDCDQADQPPNKRPNRNNYEANRETPPKNLAERRLQNLRKSLELQRHQTDRLLSSAITSKSSSPNVETKMGISNLNDSFVRKSSDLQRQKNERLSSPAFATNSLSPNVETRMGMSNLNTTSSRKSSELQRQQIARLSSPAFVADSSNVETEIGFSNLNSSSQSCSSPIQNRLKRKIYESSKSLSSSFSSNVSPNNINSSQSCLSPIQDRLKRRNYESNKSLSSSFFSNVPPNNIQTLNDSKANNLEFCEEEMDWTEIDEITVINDVNNLRKEMDYNKELPIVLETDNFIPLNTDGVFIVVDTNIFLSQLNLLSKLKEKDFPDFGRVTVVVPWMVIQELDYMKESHSSGVMVKSARRAVNYINTQLANKDPHFTGQSVMDAAKLEMSSKNPDDGILFSCLQLAEKRRKVILLSNDTNLRNKALINKIQAYNSSELFNSLSNLKSRHEEENNFVQSVQKIKILLANLLTYIIQSEMKEAYGMLWQKMALMHPPFTTEEGLNCLVKYWTAVFSFSLQKQCKLKIDEFVMFLKHHRDATNYQTNDFNKFVEHSLCLCIYLKNGYNKYKNLVSECILNVQRCAES